MVQQYSDATDKDDVCSESMIMHFLNNIYDKKYEK
jgi:hypothetical protein